MTIANWCILIAALLPYITTGIAKYGSKNFDNSAPRAWMQKLTGYRQRAASAHINHFEAFPFFAAGVLVAQQIHAPQNTINLMAMLFIVLRVFYTYLYISNRSSLRSVVWTLGALLCVGLFILAAAHH